MSPLARLGLVMVLTPLAIALVDVVTGLTPLVLLAVPVGAAMQMSGSRGALAAAVVMAVVGDFLFVEPRHRITVHAEGLRLLVLLVTTAALASVAMREARPRR